MRAPGRTPICGGRPENLFAHYAPWPAGHGGWPAGHLQLQNLAGLAPQGEYIPAVYLFFPQKTCIRGTTFGGKLDPFSPHFFPPFLPHFCLHNRASSSVLRVGKIALSLHIHISLHLSLSSSSISIQVPCTIPSSLPSITSTTPFPAAWGAFQ